MNKKISVQLYLEISNVYSELSLYTCSQQLEVVIIYYLIWQLKSGAAQQWIESVQHYQEFTHCSKNTIIDDKTDISLQYEVSDTKKSAGGVQ